MMVEEVNKGDQLQGIGIGVVLGNQLFRTRDTLLKWDRGRFQLFQVYQQSVWDGGRTNNI